MRNKKKIGAFILAGAMVLSMGTSVFAAEGNIPDVNTDGQVKITKDFQMADGLETPNVTFKFTATSETPDALSATIQDVSYTKDDNGTLQDNGMYVISKDTAIAFGGNWKHAGEYVYTVKETKESAQNVTYDESTYTLRVYVVNEENGLKVQKITAEGKDGKTDKLVFTNKYTKNDASLTIEKKTEGNHADKTKKFNFQITFTKSPMSDQETFQGKIGETTVSCTAGQAQSFQLANGEQLVFSSLPVGTTYVVTEEGAEDGYTPSVNVVENQVTTVTDRTAKSEGQSLNTVRDDGKNNLVGEKENKVTFTNTYKDIAITGIVMNNLPFILLAGIAVIAFGALAIMKKHRVSR